MFLQEAAEDGSGGIGAWFHGILSAIGGGEGSLGEEPEGDGSAGGAVFGSGDLLVLPLELAK